MNLSLLTGLLLLLQAPATVPVPDTYSLGPGDQIVVRVPNSRKSTTSRYPSI